MIHHGDCVEVMATLPESSVDAVVTDPPYGLEFMGKDWDRLEATVEHSDDGEGPWGRTRRVRFGANAMTMQTWHNQWATAALRVAKPGAYLLAFGGTRTYHRLAVAIEDSGWLIRDCLIWAYASGFPKGRANLKPAYEPIVMARKPGPLRELAIDECRIGITKGIPASPRRNAHGGDAGGIYGEFQSPPTNTDGWNPNIGRWPANVILTETPDGGGIFDGGWDGVVGGGETVSSVGVGQSNDPWLGGGRWSAENTYGDTGTYSRFFLIPKANRRDREPPIRPEWAEPGKRVSTHPTMKPTELMRHLVRLVTPPAGTVLDPFLGSGTTAIAAEQEGFAWIGIEREAEYVAIAEARLQGVQRGLGLSA